ncbi:hypothetical protein FF1_036975 [Malus domestica]
MRLSSSIGTTSTFVVPNLTNAWSRTCQWPRPWLVVTPYHLALTFLPISSAVWLRRPSQDRPIPEWSHLGLSTLAASLLRLPSTGNRRFLANGSAWASAGLPTNTLSPSQRGI